MISRGIILALKQLNGDNELVEIQIKNKNYINGIKNMLKEEKSRLISLTLIIASC
ncbi:hypothetical protein AAHB53_28030 [Niallia circulans]